MPPLLNSVSVAFIVRLFPSLGIRTILPDESDFIWNVSSPSFIHPVSFFSFLRSSVEGNVLECSSIKKSAMESTLPMRSCSMTSCSFIIRTTLSCSCTTLPSFSILLHIPASLPISLKSVFCIFGYSPSMPLAMWFRSWSNTRSIISAFPSCFTSCFKIVSIFFSYGI